MVGRTPEYLGKKIGAREMKFAVALHPDHARARAGRHRRWRWRCPASARGDAQHRAARPVRGALRLHLGGEQQRLGVRRHRGEHRLVQHRARRWRCCSAGSCRSCSCSALAGSLARQKPVPASAGTLPTHRPLFVGMLIGVDRHRRRASPTSRRSRSGRSRKDCTDVRTTDRHPTAPTPDCRPHGAPHRVGGGLLDPKHAAGRRCRTRSRKLDPRTLCKNPVMFIVEVGAVFTTVLAIAQPVGRSPG